MTHVHVPGLENFTEVGRGGYGVVYRAYQTSLHRDVAVKVLGTGALDGAARQQFEQEAKALGALGDHPHVVAVHDFGVDSHGAPYLVMPYLPAGSLSRRIAASGRLGIPEVLEIGIKLCGALESAHRLGLVHGDVKPDNVLFDDYGEPQLCDFGIAVLRDAVPHGPPPITLGFAAPEVVQGQPPTPAADVFALASTLSTALRGTAPPVADDQGRGPNRDLRGEGLPEGLCEVLDYGMLPDPTARAATSAQFGESLTEVQRQLDLPVTAMRVSQADGAAAWRARQEPPPAGTPPVLRSGPPPGVDLGGPTVERPTTAPAPPAVAAFDEEELMPPGRRRRVLIGAGTGAALLGLAAGLWWFLLRPTEDLLAGQPEIYRRLQDPAELVESLGRPDGFEGQARLLGSWWSLTEWCVASGWAEVSACYDTAAELSIDLMRADPRRITLAEDLDRVSVTEGLVEGFSLTQGHLDRTPARMELEDLVEGRPGIGVNCNPTCTDVTAEILALRPTPTPSPTAATPSASPSPTSTPTPPDAVTLPPLETAAPTPTPTPSGPAGAVGAHPTPTVGDWTVVLRSVQKADGALDRVEEIVQQAVGAAAGVGVGEDRITVADTDVLEFGSEVEPRRGFYAVLVDGYASREEAEAAAGAWRGAGFAGAYLRGPVEAA